MLGLKLNHVSKRGHCTCHGSLVVVAHAKTHSLTQSIIFKIQRHVVLQELDYELVNDLWNIHYDDVTMSLMASQITSLAIVYSTVYSGADQRKHQSSASLAFVWGIHRDRWIPRTKGQLRGKCFHLMTSSSFCSKPPIYHQSLCIGLKIWAASCHIVKSMRQCLEVIENAITNSLSLIIIQNFQD